MAPVSVLLIPAVIEITDDGMPGWDQLPHQLNILAWGGVCAMVFLLVSFVAGFGVVRQRKIVLLWMLPSGTILALAICYGAALLGGLIWQSAWL